MGPAGDRPRRVSPGEEVILDCNTLAEGAEFFSLGAASVTLDGTLLAYSVDNVGDERFTLQVKDLTTGDLLDDRLEDIAYGATWVGDDHLFYQRVDDAWRPHEIWRHRIGTPESADVCVFREDDEHYWTGVGSPVRNGSYWSPPPRRPPRRPGTWTWTPTPRVG